LCRASLGFEFRWNQEVRDCWLVVVRTGAVSSDVKGNTPNLQCIGSGPFATMILQFW
jgi:hypothetical protein